MSIDQQGRDMYPKVVPIQGNIELVQNSGVQFIDFDYMVDWEDNTLGLLKLLRTVNFYLKDDRLGFLAPKWPNEEGEETLYIDVHGTIKDGEFSMSSQTREDQLVSSDTYPDLTKYKLKDSLDLFDGVWLPIPFLRNESDVQNFGPTNWARVRIVKVDDPQAISQYLKDHKKSHNTDNRQYKSVVTESGYDYDDNNDLKPIAKSSNSSYSPDAKSMLKESQNYYRIVLAFDTRTYDQDSDLSDYAPRSNDAENGTLFKLSYKDSNCIDFVNGLTNQDSNAWVDKWLEAVFKDLCKDRLPKLKKASKEDITAQIARKEHQAHYFNILTFLGYCIDPKPVKFISNNIKNRFSNNAVIDVSLILDIGNARSCGILVEDNNSVTLADDSFNGVYPLVLRDLNAPEHVYDQAFTSQIEFAEPNFEYDNLSAKSGRVDAFAWPSLVRVGQEACNLAALKVGNEGNTGLVSPKRYLWSTDKLDKARWDFNPYSYAINSKTLHDRQMKDAGRYRAHLNDIGRFFNSNGKANFALTQDDYDRDNTKSQYSYRSTMTFMLIEIIMHALTQMNSYALRNRSSSSGIARSLKAIILTTPPCMAIEEKELYRSCVYEAIGILWKSLGFDKSPVNQFSYLTEKAIRLKLAQGEGFMSVNPPMPEVHMDWDEAESGQVVYIYNESVKTFAGHGNTFIKSLRRPMSGQRIGEKLKDEDGKELYAARIASLDIGGGTTDLVIKDYTFKKDVPYTSDDIVPVDIYKDGFKIAGDDIVHDLIKQCILPRLAIPFAKNNIKFGPIFERLVGESNTENSNTAVLRTQFTQQILVKIAYKLMFHMEHLDPFASSCIVFGTVKDFIDDTEVNESLPKNVVRPGPFKRPSNEVLDYVDKVVGETFENFAIMDFKLKFDIAKINRTILDGARFDICRVLNKLGEVLTTFNVDLLLLTGRSSKLPAIRSFFLQRLNLPSSRIVAMHNYRCDTWYPFLKDGEVIGDPKTTAAVGALINYLRFKHNKFNNFRFKSLPSAKGNSAHFVGILDATNRISDESVIYMYESAQMLSKQNANADESNFKPYHPNKESFKAPLSVQLGYRLLDDEEFEANPLYIIEAHKSIDDIKVVKDAMNMRYESIEDGIKLIDKWNSQVQEQFKPEIERLYQEFSNIEEHCGYYKKQLEDELYAEGLAWANQNMTPPPAPPVKETRKGLLGIPLSIIKSNNSAELAQYDAAMSAFEKQKQATINSYCQKFYESRVQEPFDVFLEGERYELETKIYDLINNAIDENLSKVRQEQVSRFANLSDMLSRRARFDVTLEVVPSKRSPYPVPFIAQNCPEIPKVETFKLARVEGEDGRDYAPFFRMYLKTVSGDRIKYFMDTGSIDISGLTPHPL